MHQGGGLQRVLALGAHVAARHTVELGIDQRRQTVEGGLVAVSPSLQKHTDLLRVERRHNKTFPKYCSGSLPFPLTQLEGRLLKEETAAATSLGGPRVDVNSLERSEGKIWQRLDLARKIGGASSRSTTRRWSTGWNPGPLL